jgi:hypothetical protein
MSAAWIGAWKITINLPQLGMQSRGLMTFFSDGNVNTDEVPLPFETSGHGNWVETAAGQAAYVFFFLVGDSQPGKWQEGKVSGRLAVEPSGEQWSGPFEITMLDQDGTQTFAASGTMEGARIKVAA